MEIRGAGVFKIITKLCCCLLLASADVSANQSKLVGEAFDQKSGELLYMEIHTFLNDGSGQKMKTSYVATDNSEIASRTVYFLDDKVASYALTLKSNNHKESVVRGESGLQFQVEESNSSSVKEQLDLKNPECVVIDAGINNFLLRNWDSLVAGNTLKFDFASIAQLNTVKLQVSLDEKRTTDDRVMFSMTAANMFFRLLLKPIKVGFYRESRQLAYYSGVSNLKNEDGEAYTVEITFADGQ